MKNIVIFLLILQVFWSISKIYAYSDTVTFPDGTSATISWASAQQMSDWVVQAAALGSFDAAAASMAAAAAWEGALTSYWPDGVTCANGAGISRSSWWGSSGGGYDPGPPPPPPSCSYISSWSDTWSDCAINSEWTPTGSISCHQTVSWSPNYTTLGQDSCPANAPQPSTTEDTRSIDIGSVPTSECNNSTYANNVDTCKVRINISGTVNGGKSVTGLSGKQINIITNLTTEATDRINGWGNALNFSSVSNTSIQSSGPTNFYFDISGIKSRSPFANNNGQIRFNAEGLTSSTDVTVSNIIYSFKKPFIGSLSVVGDTLKIGTEQTAKISVIPRSNLTTHTISHFQESLDATDVNYVVQNKNSETNLTTNPELGFTLNYKGSSRVGTAGIKNVPHISYSLDGENIKYILSETDNASDIAPIILDNGEFLGVKIVGALQGVWKQIITGQNSNFSNISKFEQRTYIKKSAQKFIANMSNWQILNGVKYITGDTTISGDQEYETLIVRNGNIIIDGNLNPSKKILGIIAIRDDQNKKELGNIYIKPNVTAINVMIYADGGVVSTGYKPWEDLVSSYKDSTIRTSTLNKQLIIKGSLFTRNTIGGSITGSSTWYILPGGSVTTDFNQAMMYDLNYVRRNYIGWDRNGNNLLDLGEYKNPVVIIYDERLQSTPPKGFSEK